MDTHNSLASWNLIRRVVLLTSSIQILHETLSTKIYSDSAPNTNNSGTLSIITDMEIPYGSFALEKNYLFFHPTSEYRYSSITTSGSIQSVDIAPFSSSLGRPSCPARSPLCLRTPLASTHVLSLVFLHMHLGHVLPLAAYRKAADHAPITPQLMHRRLTRPRVTHSQAGRSTSTCSLHACNATLALPRARGRTILVFVDMSASSCS